MLVREDKDAAKKGEKERYVLICASEEEREQWRKAVRKQCKGDGAGGEAKPPSRAPRLPPEVLRSASAGAFEQSALESHTL